MSNEQQDWSKGNAVEALRAHHEIRRKFCADEMEAIEHVRIRLDRPIRAAQDLSEIVGRLRSGFEAEALSRFLACRNDVKTSADLLCELHEEVIEPRDSFDRLIAEMQGDAIRKITRILVMQQALERREE